MAVVTLTATKRTTAPTKGKGDAGSLKCFISAHVAVGSADSDTSTYSFGRIPSNARIAGISRLHLDDLASTGSPTLDIGLYAVDSNITDDVDALNDGIDAASAGSSAVIKAIENYGKQAWEYVNGQTSDPGGELEVKVVLDDADVNVGGDMFMELYGIMD